MDMKTLKVLELALIVGGLFWFYRSQTQALKRRSDDSEGQSPQPSPQDDGGTGPEIR